MNWNSGPIGRFAVLLSLGLLLTSAAAVADEKESKKKPSAGLIERSAPVTPFVFDGDVRDLAPAPKWRPGDPVKEIPRRFYPAPGETQYEPSGITHFDHLNQLQREYALPRGGETFTTPSRSFAGQGYSGVNPPDTCGDVGPGHYIQMINDGSGATVAIYDKAQPIPTLLASFTLDTMGGGQCATGFGDPIVLYDRLADRWMLSEFSSSGNNLCVYISQSGDPVAGGWFNYAFTAPSFPDYPKFGVWPTDANGGAGSYIVTANDGGPGIYGLDRGAMLGGSAGTYQRVTIPGLPGFGFEAPTPADLDGPNPPANGDPGIIMRHRDTENHSGPAAPGDLLEMWTYDIDWITPSNSVLTREVDIDVSEFDSDLCGLTSFFCFPQPNSGTTLDPLREVIMNRLQYMNHGTHETLVGNLVTDVDGSDLGGIRWFELRRTGGGWSLHQEGTYSIDSDSRWMAASAMDQSGNIAVAYNVSSSTTFPSLRYTGRKADDPLNVMTQPESVIHAGTSNNSSNRYGDYSAMNLDPEDDCTFWFTGEDNTSTNWRTQIASFRFDACGCELEPPSLSISTVVGGDNQIDISWGDSSFASITNYRIRRGTAPGGPYVTVATVPDSSLGVGGGPGYIYSDTDVSGGTTYYYLVLANDGAACTSPSSNESNTTATGLCTLDPLFDGLQDVSTPFSGTCMLDLSWSAATAQCAGPIVYNIYRSETPEFTPGVGNLVAPGVSGTSATDITGLNTGVRYYYIVRAVDQSNANEEGNIAEVSAVPLGPLANGVFLDDGGDTGVTGMVMEGTWDREASGGNLGPNVYTTGAYGNSLCDALTSPAFVLGPTSVLNFNSSRAIENSYDKGEVQISTNDGASWTRLEVGYPGTSTNASDNCGLPTGDYFTGTDLAWLPFSVDLSSFAGQQAKIRFLFSTDGSVNAAGWAIDEINLTDVNVPGACATGSACEENPTVGVLPDGPMTLCDDTPVELSANLSGGVGPFSYQWTRDGVDIPGATSPTYLADEVGTHAYNVKVRAALCSDDSTDGSSTAISWKSQPDFNGLQSVDGSQEATCTIDLEWGPGSISCDGPLTYSIYRDTVSPVATTPANLIRSGLTDTEFTDTGNLIDGNFYFYVVRAVDNSNAIDDGNTVEAGAAAASPDSGLTVTFFDDFGDPGTYADWTVTDGPTNQCGSWTDATGSAQRPTAGSGAFYSANNTALPCTDFSVSATQLTSPEIDLIQPGLISVTLGYDIYFNQGNPSDQASVEIWNGSSWNTIGSVMTSDTNTHHEFDITASANSQFKVRFNYNAFGLGDQWFSVDNVFLLSDVEVQCLTSSVPPPVPDGTAVSTPLIVDRLTLSGDTVRVTWDVDSCRASDYNLLYGDLTGVSSYTLDGSQCGMTNAGDYTWNSVPSNDLFFVLVGTDGATMESSWGLDSDFDERNGPAASGQCSVTVKDTSDVCP